MSIRDQSPLHVRDQGPVLELTAPLAEGQAVGRLLRAWRHRMDRRSAHGSLGGPHRSRGRLSQADVARLTGVSEGWYRALETGTRRDFSDAFLQAVADVLRLDEAERLTLFLGVSGRRPPEEHTAPSPPPAGVLDLLEVQNPHPAYLSDESWNVVAANATMAHWFPWVREPRPNLMRWVLLAPEARTQLLDWEDDFARVYLAMLRIAANRNPGSPHLRALIGDLLTDADCRRIWSDEHGVVEHPDGHRIRLRLPVHEGAVVEVTSQVLLPVASRDLRFVIVTRNDAATAGPDRRPAP
ncbi:helix-turn-helix transcriptional regulator [Streptomyces mauvecolor]